MNNLQIFFLFSQSRGFFFICNHRHQSSVIALMENPRFDNFATIEHHHESIQILKKGFFLILTTIKFYGTTVKINIC